MKSKTLIFSRAISCIPHLPAFLPETDIQIKCFYTPTKAHQIMGWGIRPFSQKAQNFARKQKLPYIALEDGFLRSLGLSNKSILHYFGIGTHRFPPFSLVYDDLGIYYDTTRTSRLEQLILAAHFSDDELQQARTAIKLICQYQLTKYNHAPDFNFKKNNNQNIILVIDQTAGDMAVKYGQANATSFQQMLQSAVAENPTAEIWVKTHPDVISGKKKGYLTTLAYHNVRLIAENINPLSLLKQIDKVYCVTSQMGFEALLLNKPVVTFGVPWFCGWGLTDDRHPQAISLQKTTRRANRTLSALFTAAYLQYSRYINPNDGEPGSIFDVIEYLHQAKLLNQRLSGHLYCIGMSLWKRAVIKPFFNFPNCTLHFVASLDKLQHKILPPNTRLLIWGQGKDEILSFATSRNLPILRMEDGFIRSVGLGSNLTAPLSLVVDDLGIYFNSQIPSRLEKILQTHIFSEHDLQLAEKIKMKLISTNISKYNVGQINFQIPPTTKKSILVPGQVEDDASIHFGSPQIKTNLGLLQQVRLLNPDAYIIYKPHPDVLSGNRIGAVDTTTALKYADQIVEAVDILACIQQVDEIHTMTSLAGFEALMREKAVYCYGIPFYANWGLTHDYLIQTRRQRELTLQQLICATLIYYPQYIDPQTRRTINAERAIDLLQQQKIKENNNYNYLHKCWFKKQLIKLTHLYRSLT